MLLFTISGCSIINWLFIIFRLAACLGVLMNYCRIHPIKDIVHGIPRKKKELAELVAKIGIVRESWGWQSWVEGCEREYGKKVWEGYERKTEWKWRGYSKHLMYFKHTSNIAGNPSHNCSGVVSAFICWTWSRIDEVNSGVERIVLQGRVPFAKWTNM